MARPVSEATRQTLMQRQAALTALTSHPAWPELEAEVERKAQRIEKIVLAKTLASRVPIDERELVYLRGFLQGMRWLVSVPPAAENSLERFLRDQGIHAAEEETTA